MPISPIEGMHWEEGRENSLLCEALDLIFTNGLAMNQHWPVYLVFRVYYLAAVTASINLLNRGVAIAVGEYFANHF